MATWMAGPLGLEVKDLVVALAGIAGGAAAGWFTNAHFYRLATPAQQPFWAVRTASIVGSGATAVGLKVKYEDHDVPVASISHVAIWNAGRQIIRGAEAGAVNRPLTIIAKEGLLGQVKQLLVTEAENQFEPAEKLGDTSQKLTFNHLRGGDGAVFQVLHRGTDSSHVEVTGYFSSCKLRRGRPDAAMSRFDGVMMLLLLGVIAVAAPWFFIANPNQIWASDVFTWRLVIGPPASSVLSGLGFIAIFVAVLGWYQSRRIQSSRGLPKALREGLFADLPGD